MSEERRGAVVRLGDSCVALQLAPSIEPAVNARCIALAAVIEGRAFRGVRDVVPTYNSVTIHFDPLVSDGKALGVELERLASETEAESQAASHTIEIPVTYGGPAGPDLISVADFAQCSEAEVVRLHTATIYRVYMLGFLPGFAYLGTVDPRIAMPRLETPRLRVAAGSVGIAGPQTGIYPCETPGGWRVIGRTSARVFDAKRTSPFLMKAGDRVRFVAA
jgi:inhibitor of KinA